ncbi:NADP-dependent oxidoreductase domain-containing protein [Lipomyces oligophaga]|uniref:NADP-dependent oxidoreductase domain-containing protein n=1 Tax=Lipomyces oligophaga TaxID=45792 RepID=UPI0034CE3366
MVAEICTKTFTLNTGAKIPAVGLGTWQGQPGTNDSATLQQSIIYALDLGYRHIDTAAAYDVEVDVGKAIKQSNVKREDLFVTTKLWSTHHDKVEETFLKSLESLGLDYIDLYLMHWPMSLAADGKTPLEHPTPTETWLSMEAVIKKYPSKLKAIGVSNFSPALLDDLLAQASIVPAANQIELHPMLPQESLMSYCKSKGILVTAYSPLGQQKAPMLTHPVISGLADKYGVSVAQIILSWEVAYGVSTIPKSSNEGRLKQNLTLIPELDAADFKAISDLHKIKGMHRRLCQVNGHSPKYGEKVLGWTMEQLGWEPWDDPE